MAYIFLFSSFIKLSRVFSNTAVQRDEIKNSVGWFTGHERSPLRSQAISAPLISEVRSAYKRSPLRFTVMMISTEYLGWGYNLEIGE